MNIFSGAEIHDGICTPAAGPYSFFHFFFNTGANGRVTDVGIYFYEEVTADDHWFTFRMIDIRGYDSTTGSHFLSYKFRCDEFYGCIGTEGMAFMLFPECIIFFEEFFHALIFTDGDVFHFRCDDA